MFVAETQEAGIIISLIIAVGMALLSRLLFRPKDQQILRNKVPNSPSERGSFIPYVLGTRRVGAVVLYVGDRRDKQEVVSSSSKSGDVTQTVYFEKAIHALCVGPANRILGIYIDGELVPNSEFIDRDLNPEGTSITFPKVGTMRIYWGLETSVGGSLLQEVIGIPTIAPYIMRIEWDDFRLGFGVRWPSIEYIVEVTCVGVEGIAPPSESPFGQGVNPAMALLQVWTAKYPHGAGLDPAWFDYVKIGELATLAETEEIVFNILVTEGEALDAVVGSMMQDFGFLLSECNGVISPVPIRQLVGQDNDDVPLLSNDLLSPPVDEIEKIHISRLGDALVYQYVDREQLYRTATIDVDDDSIGAIRNQRKTKKISIENVTDRAVASRIASRRQIEDLTDYLTVKLKGLRGLRSSLPGMPFDLPGIGRCRLMGYKLLWNEPTIQMELLQDPFDQEILNYTDPGLGECLIQNALEKDIRFDSYELPFIATGGQNILIMLRHRDNCSMVNHVVHVSNDGVNFYQESTQRKAATGGVLAADWDEHHVMAIIEKGPLITIDDNGDEVGAANLSGSLASWLSGAQIMVIGSDPRTSEFFFIREWIEITPNTTWQPLGLIRGRYHTGQKDPRLWQDPRYTARLAGEPCYIINKNDIVQHVGGTVGYAGVLQTKSQPGDNGSFIPLGAVLPDIVEMTSQGSGVPPISAAYCGGQHPEPPSITTHRGRRDSTHNKAIIAFPWVQENVVFEIFRTAAINGAGLTGLGQPGVPEEEGEVSIQTYFSAETIGIPLEEAVFDFGSEHILTLQDNYDAATNKWFFIYTTDLRIADTLAAGHGDQIFLPWSDDYTSGQGFVWRFVIRNRVLSSYSPSVTLSPHALTDTATGRYVPGWTP